MEIKHQDFLLSSTPIVEVICISYLILVKNIYLDLNFISKLFLSECDYVYSMI